MRKRNPKTRIGTLKQASAEPTVVNIPAQTNGNLPNIFRKQTKYDYYDDRETVSIEPHEIYPATVALLYNVDAKTRGENIDPQVLQEQADVIKYVTNPFTGEPICKSIYTTALDHVSGFNNIPLADPNNPFNTTDRLRVTAIDAAFRNYALNAINTVIRDANNIFYTALAQKITSAGLKTKVVLTDGMAYEMAAPFILDYNSEDDEIVAHPVFSSQLFTKYTFGTLLTSYEPDCNYRHTPSYNPIDNNNIRSIQGNLVDLSIYESCKDFWSLVMSILPIFEMNYNALVQTMANTRCNIYRQNLVDIFFKAYAEVQPIVISAMENLVYVLWCESDIYVAAKYGGTKPAGYLYKNLDEF